MGIAGIPLFYWMSRWPGSAYTVTTLALIGGSVWLHHVGDRILGQKDSRLLVWDELAGYLVAVAYLPFTWQIAVASFVLERAFDIAKVQPAKWVEDHLRGGWGVVGDDLVAGFYTCTILHAVKSLAPSLAGL